MKFAAKRATYPRKQCSSISCIPVFCRSENNIQILSVSCRLCIHIYKRGSAKPWGGGRGAKVGDVVASGVEVAELDGHICRMETMS